MKKYWKFWLLPVVLFVFTFSAFHWGKIQQHSSIKRGIASTSDAKLEFVDGERLRGATPDYDNTIFLKITDDDGVCFSVLRRNDQVAISCFRK